MNVPGPFQSAARGGFKPLAALPRPVQKPSESASLGARSQHRDQDRQAPPPRLQVELVCQDETRGFDPFWDGPRLLPSFVAQVLGQAMPHRPEGRRDHGVSVETAYGCCHPRRTLLVDRKS